MSLLHRTVSALPAHYAAAHHHRHGRHRWTAGISRRSQIETTTCLFRIQRLRRLSGRFIRNAVTFLTTLAEECPPAAAPQLLHLDQGNLAAHAGTFAMGQPMRLEHTGALPGKEVEGIGTRLTHQLA